MQRGKSQPLDWDLVELLFFDVGVARDENGRKGRGILEYRQFTKIYNCQR